MIARLALVLLLCAPLAASPADRDRPGDNWLPSPADACAGRVDVYPARYYEMRAERLQAGFSGRAIVSEDDLLAVDDLAVALLRLGRPDSAIVWLDRKQAPIDAIRERDPRAGILHTDRTLKNKAMCLVARWRQGQNASDLDQALELLRQAETASRHLHENWFLAREVEYLRARPEQRGTLLPNVLGVTEEHFRDARRAGSLSRLKLSAAIENMTRRVSYGGERENPDLFYALSLACALEGRDMEAYFAFARAAQLVDSGARLACRHSLGPTALRAALGAHLNPGRQQEFAAQFEGLQRTGAQWRLRRAEFVEQALARGGHPDTDPGFWSRWQNEETRAVAPAPVTDPGTPPEPIVGTALFIGGGAMVLFLFLVVGGLAIYFARRHPPAPSVDEL